MESWQNLFDHVKLLETETWNYFQNISVFIVPLVCLCDNEPLKGYDAPTDTQLAVDLAALGVLSLLLQLFGVSEANGALVRLWQTLKVKLVNLDGHPVIRDERSTYRCIYSNITLYKPKKNRQMY